MPAVRSLFEKERELTEYAIAAMHSADLVGWVAEHDAAIVGVILTHMMEPERRGGVDELLVAAGHRDRGVGDALMREAEAYYREAGAAGMRLTVREGNASAEHLYQERGYRVVQRRLRMEKDF